MRILGIESSCDDTAGAVVEDGRQLIVAERLSSSSLQRRFGGIVPEVAAREHTLAVLPVVAGLMESAKLDQSDIDAVAVTQGPGLIGALLVGVTFAKALALAWHKPLIGVHHLEAHMYVNALVEPIQFPALVLVVSGGHTSLVYWRDHGDLTVLGSTRDDAAGEAFDKGARILGLSYPGGPEIEKLAATAPSEVLFSLPVARLEAGSLDFSFSGVKTAFSALVKAHSEARAECAKALEDAIVEALCRNLNMAYEHYPVHQVYLAGGVAANTRLQERVREWGRCHGVAVHVPPREYCTDNGAMVAAAGYYRYRLGYAMSMADGPLTPWPLQNVSIKGG